MSLSQTLVVPIDVRAFCIGDGDRNTVEDFAGITLDFSHLKPASTDHGAAIVSRENGVFRDPDFRSGKPDGSQPLAPLARGIHLHWNLPRALTHGQGANQDGNISFPIVPNRWLVTRIADTVDPFQYARSWIVESDHIATDAPDGLASVTIFTGYDNDQPYRYLGRVVPAAGWTEPEPGTSTLKNLTQSDLTAMQTGDPLFASFYPNCRNIFAIHDDLADAASPPEGVAIQYIVAGWYSNSANDPLNGGLDAAALLDRFKWAVPDGVDGPFDRSLFAGLVQGIRLSAQGTYVPANDPVTVTLGAGNNGAEALSALIGGAVDDPDHRVALEQLLSAYQIGALSEIYEPHPDRMAELQDQLHASGFSHSPGGTIWTVVQGDDPGASVSLSDLSLVSGLPDLLTALNLSQEKYNRQTAVVDSLRRHLYLDWYRYGTTKIDFDTDPSNTDYQDRLGNIDAYIRDSGVLLLDPATGTAMVELTACSHALQQAQQAASDAVAAHGWALKALMAPWYWRANDPVVVVSGDDTIHRLQGNDAGQPVPCRPANLLISSIFVRGTAIDGAASRFGAVPPPAAPVPVAVWDEATLLNAAYLTRTAGGSDVQQGLQQFLDDGKANDVITAHNGRPPIADAVQWWENENPWLPLFMGWNADYYSAPGYDGDKQDIPPDYITGQFTLDDDGSMSPNGWNPGNQKWSFSGQSILTPLITRRLLAALGADAEADGLTDDISNARDYLQKTPMLYQGLSGLADALLMLGHIPQLAGDATDGNNQDIVVNGDDHLFYLVNGFVGSARRLAAYPNNSFVPVRAGYLGLDLTLIDVFGRSRAASISQVRAAPGLRTPDSERRAQIYLPPRLSQPARLKFDFLSASSDTDQANLLASPLCGWLVPNHLDDAIVAYGADGTPWCVLEMLSQSVHCMGAPGPGFGSDPFQTASSVNRHLVDLVRALSNGGREQFARVQSCIDNVSAATTGSVPQDPSLSILIGRPVAVVKSVLELELLGTPAVNQRWDAFDADYNNADMSKPDSFVAGRANAGIADVQIEVVLGNQGRFRDGLFGFFVAGDGGQYDFSRFYSPASGHVSGVLPPRVKLSPGSGGTRILMLMDPLARVHAVSGLLPTETITLPPDLTVPFVTKLAMTFPVRPVLSDNAGFDLPLPAENGYSWSWVQQDGGDWVTTPLSPVPSSATPRHSPQRLYSGWLKLMPVGNTN